MPTKRRESANVLEKEMQYLHEDGGDLVFIDSSNHAQVTVSKELIGDAADLLTGNLVCTMSFLDERPIDVALPTFVQLDVTSIESSTDHDAATGNVTKRSTVETGAVIDVPQFIHVGDTIKIDTRTHEYVDRVERVDN